MSVHHTKHVVLGRLDRAVAEAIDNFALPVLELDAHTLATEAFKGALATRQATALLGPKGVGKTEAILDVIAAFEAEQFAALALSPEAYQVKRVLYLPRLTGKTVRGCTLAILRLISPTTAHDRVHGTRLEDDELLEQLVRELVMDRYSVVVIDELETATEQGIEFARRLLASAQTVGRASRSDAVLAYGRGGGGAVEDPFGGSRAEEDVVGPASLAGPTHAHRGALGLVLVGTPAEVRMLTATGDAHGRWSQFLMVPQMSEAEIGDAYVQVFPRFAEAAQQMGLAAWTEFLHHNVTRGRRLAIRHLGNHCALYFKAMFEARLDVAPDAPWTDRSQVPFDRERFLYALTQADSVPDVVDVPTTRRRRVNR